MTAPELVEVLQARGVVLEPHGNMLQVRPASRVSPEELERLRALKADVLALLAPVLRPAQTELRPGTASFYASPWPDALPGLGARSVGPFDICEACGYGSWVRYGSAVLCLACAERVQGGAR